MADKENKGFRQERKAAFNPTEIQETNPETPPTFADVMQNREDMGLESPVGVEIKGNVPPELQRQMQKGMQQQKRNKQQFAPEQFEQPSPQNRFKQFSDPALENVLRKLQTKYEEVLLPSLGKFYNGTDAPTNGVLHIRPMTGAEEQIMATPRFVKKGQAINKIFEAVVFEDINPDALLTIDRTFLLIYLRGISFTPQYDVDISCPVCSARFQSVIDLNSLDVNECPDNFSSESLTGVLPTSGLKFRYRLSTGRDEQLVTEHKERRLKEFGETAVDDTLIYRASLLLEEIEGVTGQQALQMIISKLAVNDVAFLRNLVNEPPFGVETDIDMICPSCTSEFEIDMPMESNFFFPRHNDKKKEMEMSENG
jgi:hypothetical protein